MKTHCFSHILLRAAAGAVLFFSALFSLFGCTYNQRLKRVLAVEPEVPYGCAAVGEAGSAHTGGAPSAKAKRPPSFTWTTAPEPAS